MAEAFRYQASNVCRASSSVQVRLGSPRISLWSRTAGDGCGETEAQGTRTFDWRAGNHRTLTTAIRNVLRPWMRGDILHWSRLRECRKFLAVADANKGSLESGLDGLSSLDMLRPHHGHERAERELPAELQALLRQKAISHTENLRGPAPRHGEALTSRRSRDLGLGPRPHGL